MKIIHASPTSRRSPGIFKQLQMERTAALSMTETTWDVFSVEDVMKPEKVGASRLAKRVGSLGGRIRFYNKLTKLVGLEDLLLLRYAPGEIIQAFYILLLRLLGKKIVLCHHTLELDELAIRKGLQAKLYFAQEKFLGASVRKMAVGVIGVTKEIVEHELLRRGAVCPAFVYPNGVWLNDDEEEVNAEGRLLCEGVPQILFVASNFVPWHGLDLLLEDVPMSELEFKLHVVGRVYPEHMAAVEGDSRVVFHGKLEGEDLTSIMQGADVGLSCFSLERKGMIEACPLKVREYLLYGTPVYSGHPDVFPEDAYFYREGNCSIKSIVEYAQEFKGVDRTKVMNDSSAYIDKKEIMKTLATQLKLDLQC